MLIWGIESMDTDYFEFLKSCFDEWNTKNPEKNTIRGLARITGIGKNVVYNMANGIPRQSKYGYNEISQYLKRTQVEKSLYLDFIKTHYQDFILFAEQLIADRESSQTSSDRLIELLRRPVACDLFQACITKRGLKRSEVNEKFGTEGVKALELFIQKEVLAEKNGWIRHSQSENIAFDEFLSNHLIRHNIENFDFEKFETFEAFQWILVRSISKKVFEEVKNISNETFEKIHKLTQEESSEEDSIILKINFLLDSDKFSR